MATILIHMEEKLCAKVRETIRHVSASLYVNRRTCKVAQSAQHDHMFLAAG